jgi:acyl-CoA synthetase (AMP-forming)/AMP-acid ligase II
VGSGGAVFSESKQNKFREIFPNCFITNAFGSSESGQMGMDSGQKKTEGGLGNVIKGEFMSVVMDDENPPRHAKAGETGNFARAGHIPVGYYNDPEKTAKTFIQIEGKTWLLTGDQAKLEEDGESISVFGRGSNCINSGGEKIFVEEVEQALKANPDIYDALVVATPDERWGSKVTAVVEVREGVTPSLSAVQDDARKYIAGYKVPRELHVTEQIHRLPNGKPDYKSAKAFALSKEGLIA